MSTENQTLAAAEPATEPQTEDEMAGAAPKEDVPLEPVSHSGDGSRLINPAEIALLKELADERKNDNKDWSERQVPDINGDMADKMFPESTHSYLIYWPQDPNPNGLIASILVLVLQFICYVVSVNAAIGDIKTAFLLPLKMFSANCDDGKPEQAESGGVNAFNEDSIYELSCEAAYSDWKQDESKLLLSFMLTCILFVMFVQYDYFACLKTVFSAKKKWSRFVSLVIVSEALFAFVAGVTFATVGVFQASSYAAISNLLGVLFVHDLDEKMFETTSLLDDGFLDTIFKKKGKKNCCKEDGCCLKYRPTFCMFGLMLFCCMAGLVMYISYASSVVLDEEGFREYAEEEWGWEGYFSYFYDESGMYSSDYSATGAPYGATPGPYSGGATTTWS